MKKIKKIKLKKESILSLDKNSMNNILGGDFSQDYFTCAATGLPSFAICPPGGYPPNYQGDRSIGYCGTLNNCGTGMAYCVTNDCFFNSQPCH